MIVSLKAFFLSHATVVTYMLQSTEYEVWPYLKWYWRTQNFARVTHRRTLDRTKRARLLLMSLRFGMALQVIFGISLIVAAVQAEDFADGVYFGLALVVSYPIVWAHLVVVPLLAAKWFVVAPSDRRAIEESEKIFAEHGAAKIAIVGSYGKTTMKELLATVLGEGKKVAATPGNKNVATSHANFARKLDGDEEVLIIEYGEGAPGDVGRFAQVTQPTHAVITGLAPAHLDKYKTLERAGQDIFSVADHVDLGKLYVNAESPAAKTYIKKDYIEYSENGVQDWKVDDVEVSVDGTSFTLSNKTTNLALRTGLLGRHQVGPISVAAVLGLQLGLTKQQVEAGVAKTIAFEHRMQAYQLGGAWIIDDTYNGNLEGIRVGTELLHELPAKRKWYVTPGLVEQGSETAAIHREVGQLIARSEPDIVVLMRNSVTEYIRAGLESSGYKGEVRIETDPLAFYTNLDHFVTRGDIVLMQNDWTDNYA